MSSENTKPLPPAAQEILDFWLKAEDQESLLTRWFRGGPELDQEIQARFGKLLTAAEARQLESWHDQPQSLLALIILLDQFSRQIYRGSGQAFGNDAYALELAELALSRGWDQDFPPLTRMFFYLPFEHAESRAQQARAVALFTALQQGVPAAEQDLFTYFLDYALSHQAVVERFGRFPHRNARLGRESTAEELAFLQEPGSSFG